MSNEIQAPVATPVVPEVAPKKKGLSRFFGFVLLALCAVAAYFVAFAVFNDDWSTKTSTLVKFAMELSKDDLSNLFKGSVVVIIGNLLPYALALCLALAVLLFLVALLGGCKGCVKAGLVFVILGSLAQIAGITALSYVKTDKWVFDTMAIALFVVALLSLVVFCVAARKAKTVVEEAEAPVEEAPVEDPLASFSKEEVIEAVPYEGGPVAGIEIAEEVYPTLASIEAQKDPDGVARNTVASLLGNGFDAFLITLNEKEKSEFIDLYVLKCKGLMPEIPGYVVGGDNKEFFNKVFIYLGQYREKIPGDLLSKMYNFSMKI